MSNPTTFTFAGKRYALLSRTSAMSCYSFSLLASISCPGRVDNGPQSICHGCYGELGCYNFKNTLSAQAARFAWTVACMRFNRQLWIDTLVNAINATGERYFRWHDSGDLFSPEYARMVIEVCRRAPNVKHWLPTRSSRLPWVDVIRELAALPNVITRPSALTFDDAAPSIDRLGKGSTAITALDRVPRGHRLCPKTTADHKTASCESVGCRRCWSNRQPVAYLAHGRRGMHKVHHSTERERENAVRHATPRLRSSPLRPSRHNGPLINSPQPQWERETEVDSDCAEYDACYTCTIAVAAINCGWGRGALRSCPRWLSVPRGQRTVPNQQSQMEGTMARPEDPKKLEHWRKVIAKQAASSKTIAAFCKAEGLSPSVFFWWKRKIAKVDDGGQIASGPSSAPSNWANFNAQLPDVLAKLGASVTDGAGTRVMTIHLPNGVRLELPADNLELVEAVVGQLAGTAYKAEPRRQSRPAKRRRSKRSK